MATMTKPAASVYARNYCIEPSQYDTLVSIFDDSIVLSDASATIWAATGCKLYIDTETDPCKAYRRIVDVLCLVLKDNNYAYADVQRIEISPLHACILYAGGKITREQLVYSVSSRDYIEIYNYMVAGFELTLRISRHQKGIFITNHRGREL